MGPLLAAMHSKGKEGPRQGGEAQRRRLAFASPLNTYSPLVRSTILFPSRRDSMRRARSRSMAIGSMSEAARVKQCCASIARVALRTARRFSRISLTIPSFLCSTAFEDLACTHG